VNSAAPIGGSVINMRLSEHIEEKPGDAIDETPVHEANFYALPFVSQMVVWAMRKRMSKICGWETRSDDVSHAFRLANWGETHAAILKIVDILLNAGTCGKLLLHSVSCPSLATHEAYLLNALAHLQRDLPDVSIFCLRKILAPSGVRLAIPQLEIIVGTVNAENLRFVYVDLSTIAPSGHAKPAPRRLRSVH
jgi:hypothetical protein